MHSIRYSGFVLFLFFTAELFACNSSSHHSVLSHYNQAFNIFEGKVISSGNLNKKKDCFIDSETGLSCIYVQFEVLTVYKNCEFNEKITVGIPPGLYPLFNSGERYLIYTVEKVNYDSIICHTAVPYSDSAALLSHQFLFSLPSEYSGYITEKSVYGRVWAEGKLEKGLAVGDWNYYALSGELQIKGSYKEGEEEGEWQYFFHTNDQNYTILHDIISGVYFNKFKDYELIFMDSTLSGEHKNKISYTVGTDTISEYFFFTERLFSKKVHYLKGLRNGNEQKFNTEGQCISLYTFINDVLEGDFFELLPIRTQKSSFIRVEGTYLNDSKFNESHLYFDNKELIRTKHILKNGKLI